MVLISLIYKCNPLKILKTSILVFILFSSSKICYAQIQIGNDINGELAEENCGFSISMPSKNIIAIGSFHSDKFGSLRGVANVYEWKDNLWKRKGQEIYGLIDQELCGISVCMPDTNTLAVGSSFTDASTDTGRVKVYDWNGTNWVQRGASIVGKNSKDGFGISISMPDKNTIAIGAIHNDASANDAGQVRVYKWKNGQWVQIGNELNGEAATDFFGWSVHMPDTNTIAVGARRNSGNGQYAGHVRVFYWNGTNWIQKGIDIDGEDPMDLSGTSVFMSNSNLLAIGAPGHDTSRGQVRVFQWDGINWNLKGPIIHGINHEIIGWSVCMPDSNTIGVGGIAENGLARVYKWNGSNWIQIGIDMQGVNLKDYFGYAVSMPDTSYIAVSGPYNDYIGKDAGHVRVYSLYTPLVIPNYPDLVNEIKVYPNPTKDKIEIELRRQYERISIVIKNYFGQMIDKIDFKKCQICQISIPETKGFYFVEISCDDKVKTVVKVLKE